MAISGKQFKKYKEASGMTLKEVGEVLGVSGGFIGQWLSRGVPAKYEKRVVKLLKMKSPSPRKARTSRLNTTAQPTLHQPSALSQEFIQNVVSKITITELSELPQSEQSKVLILVKNIEATWGEVLEMVEELKKKFPKLNIR